MLRVLALTLALGMQDPDPALAEWQAAVTQAQQDGEMDATVGRLTGTDDRVVLCALNGSVTVLRCFHSTQRMVDGVEVANHSEPVDYDGTPLADILSAERAWASP